jgi:ubiquinone/menaquinone biosynthesis C-methylase UbiE
LLLHTVVDFEEEVLDVSGSTDPDSGLSDRWLSWLKTGRDAGEMEARRRTLARLRPVYDRVLDGAELTAGETVLEIGAGEGMLGLLALERVGPSGHVVLSDHSGSVIAALRDSLATGASDRVDVLTAPVETLAGIDDASVDVVVCRSVLIYSRDLRAALISVARVLRPGGRISAFEPLWQFFDPAATPTEFFGRALPDCEAEIAAVMAGYREDLQALLEPPFTTEFLIAAAEAAGFTSIKATVEAESEPLPVGDDLDVKVALNSKPNPETCSPAEMATRMLNSARAAKFLAAIEESVRTGRRRSRRATVYFRAER